MPQHYGGRNSGRNRNNSQNRSRRRGPTKQNINPSRFVKSATQVTDDVKGPKNSFSDFSLHPKLHENITKKGFKVPSAIQDKAIPAGLEGQDIFGIANTGTGKTAAFALPVMNQLLQTKNSKAIIVAPTRELAGQILDEFRSLGADDRAIYWTLLIGGAPMGKQLKDLSRSPNLIIGTPGRIKDHIQRGSLRPQDVNLAVLDEVDRMLDMGFIDDMRGIIKQLSPNRQSFFFSATTNHRIEGLVGEFANNPRKIVTKTTDTSELVEQDVVRFAGHADKLDKLHDLLLQDSNNKVLIFDETRRDVEKLHKALQGKGFNSDSIHGGKSQGQRRRALANFKRSDSNILVATDVASRGIDVSDITHVINYSTPQSYTDYVHRVGRAGRAGRTGYAFTFVPR